MEGERAGVAQGVQEKLRLAKSDPVEHLQPRLVGPAREDRARRRGQDHVMPTGCQEPGHHEDTGRLSAPSPMEVRLEDLHRPSIAS